MNMLALLLTIPLSGAETDAPAIDADVLSLENQVLCLKMRKEPVPSIEELVHKQTGAVVVSGPQNRDLFQFVFNEDDGRQKTVSASAARMRCSRSMACARGSRVPGGFLRRT